MSNILDDVVALVCILPRADVLSRFPHFFVCFVPLLHSVMLTPM